ncbi:MAG: glucose-1-phosphate adenylyltransferase subunit GlgD [Halanaerobiaceae bacterium]
MGKLIGLINLDKQKGFLNELTYFRSDAAIPFAGRYRLIDFTLSNMTNAGIGEVAIFVRDKYRSLMDHLGKGSTWSLDRKLGGLFILPPDWHDPTDISQGDLKFFHNNMSFFRRGSSRHVLYTDCQHICDIDYKKVLKYHEEKDADITLIYTDAKNMDDEFGGCRRLTIDKEKILKNINNDPENKNIYMEKFIIKKELLLEIVKYCIAYGKDDFFRDGIMERIGEYKVRTYNYQGYHAFINSIESYYKKSMELLDMNNYQTLFNPDNLVLTKVKDEIPSKYYNSSNVSNSIVANGCKIKGEVKNSILFRGVIVDEGARIENSIIMQDTIVAKGAFLRNVISDKQVSISENIDLRGSQEQPYVIAKNASI